MYFFFPFLNVKDAKRKTKSHKDLKYCTQNDIFDNFSSKEKGRLKMTLLILNKNAFDTLNVNKSNQMHQENFN